MSVITGILDLETLKHTVQYQGAKADVELLKRKVMEFTNMMGGSKGDAMDISRLETEKQNDQEQEEEWDEEG